MNFYWLTIGSLVTWRVSHLFYAEDGPGDIFVRLRRAVGEGFRGSLSIAFTASVCGSHYHWRIG